MLCHIELLEVPDHRVRIKSVHKKLALAIPPQQIYVVIIQSTGNIILVFIYRTQCLLYLTDFDLALRLFFLIDF